MLIHLRFGRICYFGAVYVLSRVSCKMHCNGFFEMAIFLVSVINHAIMFRDGLSVSRI